MTTTHYDSAHAPTTDEEALSREGIVALTARKTEITRSLTERKKQITRLSIEAETIDDPADTLELIKFETETAREEESRLEGIENAIKLVGSEANLHRLHGAIKHKVEGLNRAADLLEEEARQHAKIEKLERALVGAIGSVMTLRAEVHSIVSRATVRKLIRPNGAVELISEGARGISKSQMEHVIAAISHEIGMAAKPGVHRNPVKALAFKERVAKCKEGAQSLRGFDQRVFPEHDEIEAIGKFLGYWETE